MKTKLFLLLALVLAVMISGCAKKEAEETPLLEMEGKMSNKFYLPPSDATGQISVEVELTERNTSFSLVNYNATTTRVQLFAQVIRSR